MKIKEFAQKLLELVEKNNIPADTVILAAGDEDAGAIIDIDFFPNCTEDELPYDGGGNTDEYLGKNIIVLRGDWN